MSRTATIALALLVGLAVGIPLGGRLMPSSAESAAVGAAFSAVANAIGAEDVSGPYEVVPGWPKDLSTLPGHDKWTFGGARGSLRREPESRLPDQRRRAAEHPSPRHDSFSPRSDRTCSFLSPGFRGATRTPRLRRRRAGRARILRRAWSSGEVRRRAVSGTRPGFPLGTLHRRRGRAGQHHRGVDAVGQAVQASARRLHQPVRFREARVGGRRSHARDLQVHERRQAARPDDRHAERSWRGRDTLQPADLHGVAARRQLLRRPTATTARASRSSTRRASSCSISASGAKPGRRRVRAT